MKIYIDNEEVLCASNMTIKEELKNTNSVILNNVYPKSWEQDRDYVSRFYMPKDYSHCEIIEENPEIHENTLTSYGYGNRYPDNDTLKITSLTNTRLGFIAVIPNQTYKISMNSTETGYFYECDSFSIGTDITRLEEIETGEKTYTLVPTKKYIVYQTRNSSGILIRSASNIKLIGPVILNNLVDNLYLKENRLLNYSDSQIRYSTSYSIKYIKVIPGVTYLIKITNSGGVKNICETDSLDIGTITTPIQYIEFANGTVSYTITPTKKYLVFTSNLTLSELYFPQTTDLIFSGVIKNSGNINLNPRYPHYSTLQLLDYKTFLSECDNLNYVLQSQSVFSCIKEVVKNLDGFMVGKVNIEDLDTIAAYNCNEKTPYDVFEYLAEITNSIWYTEAVSKDLVLINFVSEGNLNQADAIEYTKEYFEEHNIQDIKYTYNTKDYRNKQVITSDRAKSGIPQVEYLTYYGNNLKTTYPIDKIVSITSGSSTYTVSTRQAQQNGSYATFYYNYGSNEIEVNRSFGTEKTFKVEYYSVVATRQTVYNQDEINRIHEGTGRNGTLARYEKRTDTSDTEALNQIAQTYLNYKGTPEIKVTLKTYFKDILKIGDRVFFNGPLEDLKTNYLVIQKNVNMITTGNEQKIFYEYILSSSFNDENAINYFDNQRRKLSGNIEDGEYITRYIDFPSETNIIFYDLESTEMEIPNDILDGELDVELIGSESNSKLDAKLEFKL